MSKRGYALDTNIVIKLLRPKSDPLVQARLDAALFNDVEIVIPQAVHYEMLRGIYCRNAASQEAWYRLFRDICTVGMLTEITWEYAALLYYKLRKKGCTIGDADILIGAFCLENNYTLVTANTKDFRDMNGLRLEDWTQA